MREIKSVKQQFSSVYNDNSNKSYKGTLHGTRDEQGQMRTLWNRTEGRSWEVWGQRQCQVPRQMGRMSLVQSLLSEARP